MKKTFILLLCFIACIMACEDNHHADEDPQIESYVRDNFFNLNFISDKNESIGNANKLKSSFKITASQEDLNFREQIMDYYQNKLHYAQQIKDKVGLPVWDHLFYNTLDVDKLAFIPCAKENSIYTEGLVIVLFSKEKNKLLFNYVDRYNFDAYLNPLVEMEYQNVPDRTYIMGLFLLFDKQLFNYCDCDILEELAYLLNIEKNTGTKAIETRCDYTITIVETTHMLEGFAGGKSVGHRYSHTTKDIEYEWICSDITSPDIKWGNEEGGSSSSGKEPKEPDSDEDKNSEDPTPAPPVKEDKSWKDTKADCIYDKIKNETSVLQDLLKEFMPTKSTFTLVLDVGYIPVNMSTGTPRIVYGKTYGTRSKNNKYSDPIYNNIIHIRLNENTIEKSNLLICNTILHEIIHAEILKTQEEATKENGKVNPKILKESYPGLIEAYVNSKNISEAQHIYMINQMHEKMVSILKWFDKDNHTNEEYEAIAWLGLDKNHVFTSKFNENEIKRIDKLQKKLINEKDSCD